MFLKVKAFTLAEILITLLIIGVVASLVIPAIIQDTEKAETVTQVKKYQSILSQAVLNIRTEYGSIMNSPINSNGNHFTGWNTLKNYLNLTKDCGTTSNQDCWVNTMYKYLDDSDWVNFDNYATTGRGILADGSTIDYEAKANCTANRSTTHSGPLHDSNCALIFIDINGHKPPNKSGKDVFLWYIMNDGTVHPVGSLDDTSNNCSISGGGTGCAAKIIKEGKMDY
jgi:prepilin-type N-terminal cleavage/methylation domain-containing protein